MEMSESSPPSDLLPMGSALTPSSEASLVKTSLGLGSVVGWLASAADYGLSSPVLFASFDRDTSSWKTSQSSLFGGWAESSETWPQAGMMRNGKAYRRRPSIARSFVRASGFWPTPLASETGYRRKRFTQGGVPLSMAVGGPVNPTWAEWLMGFPTGWTDLGVSGMQLSPKSPS